MNRSPIEPNSLFARLLEGRVMISVDHGDIVLVDRESGVRVRCKVAPAVDRDYLD